MNVFESKYFIPVTALIVVVIGLFLGYQYYITTSYYSLSQVQHAIKTHDTALFDKHLDINKITVTVSNKMMDEMDEAVSLGDSATQMKVSLAKGFIRDAEGAFEIYLLNFFHHDLIEKGGRLDLKVKKVVNQGDYVRTFTLENPKTGKMTEIKLEKVVEKNYWKIISLDLNGLVETGIISGQPDLVSVLQQRQ